jgi:broad specificity phosphatase PhoE
LVLTVCFLQQAKALGESLSGYRVDAFFASDLLRAAQTVSIRIKATRPFSSPMLQAQQIQEHQPEPQPPITLSPLFQEQYWGVAEGHQYAMSKGMPAYYREPGRSFKFELGENQDDVKARAEKA